MAGLQERFEESAQWLIKSIQAFLNTNDPDGAKRNSANFLVFCRSAPPELQPKLKGMWENAGLGALPA